MRYEAGEGVYNLDLKQSHGESVGNLVGKPKKKEFRFQISIREMEQLLPIKLHTKHKGHN